MYTVKRYGIEVRRFAEVSIAVQKVASFRPLTSCLAVRQPSTWSLGLSRLCDDSCMSASVAIHAEISTHELILSG